MTIYEKIKKLCENAGFPVSSIGERIPNMKINKASVTGWKNGSKPRPDKIKIIADYFGVPVSYFTEDEPVNVHTVQDNHGIIGHAHAPVTINGGADQQLSEQAAELLGIFESLNVVNKARLLAYAAELKEKQ